MKSLKEILGSLKGSGGAGSVKDMLHRMSRGPTDVVGIDIGTSATKVVRIKKSGAGFTLLGAAILPAIPIPDEADGKKDFEVTPLVLPDEVRGRYAALCVTGPDAVVKLLSFPGRLEHNADDQIVGNMGLDAAADYRIGYKVVTEGQGRTESKVLAAAIPDRVARVPAMILPGGLPVPFSVEISGLASMSAFMHGPASQETNDAVGCVDLGARVSYFALFTKNRLALLRKFHFGTEAILGKISEALNIDRDTADKILKDGSFDVSQPVSEVVEPFIKQLIISRDFVERRQNCTISRIYMSGGVANSRDLISEIQTSFGIDLQQWNPFDATIVDANVLPATFKGQEGRFAAAVGACLGTFEET